MPEKKTESIDLGELLAEEFDYIAETATQANEDRARVASFYLIAVGSLIAAMFSTQFFGPEFEAQNVALLFCGLFTGLTALGTTTIMQLARLRSAWYESTLAMNQLKDYMVSRHPDLGAAFRWRMHTMPALYKPNSISFIQTLEVAMLSGLTFGGAAYFLLYKINIIEYNMLASAVLGLLMVIGQVYLYKFLLNREQRKRK